jgi:hypothetical protein
MTDKARTTVAVLATTLFLGAMSAVGALQHRHAASVTAAGQARPSLVTGPRTVPFTDSESITND